LSANVDWHAGATIAKTEAGTDALGPYPALSVNGVVSHGVMGRVRSF
jgi:hypothetical protein